MVVLPDKMSHLDAESASRAVHFLPDKMSSDGENVCTDDYLNTGMAPYDAMTAYVAELPIL